MKNNLLAHSRVRIRHGVVTHIKRHLPYSKSRIKASVNQEVSPGDILAECFMPPGFRVVHLSKLLGVNPKDVKKYLARVPGRNIYQGEILAFKKELFGLKNNIVLSPVDGIVDVVDEKLGDLRIKYIPKMTELASGVYGVIDKIDPVDSTFIIRTTVDVIYGMFGSGKEREGVIMLLGKSDNLVSTNQIKPGMDKKILVTGGIVFWEGLQKAVNLGVSGMITGGINARDYLAIVGGSLSLSKREWTDIGMTFLVSEGFGSIPIGDDIFPLLEQHQGRFAIIEGNQNRLILPSHDKNSIIYTRKTRLPVSRAGLEIGAVPEDEKLILKVGSKVRGISMPYLGTQGVVRAIDETPSKIETGITTYLITVETNRGKFRMPYTNLEIIG